MTLLAGLALLIWVYLLVGHGRFWQAGPMLPEPVLPGSMLPGTMLHGTLLPGPMLPGPMAGGTPSVAVVVPARDEAELIGLTLGSLLAQDYAGALRVILVDDNSSDATSAIARSFGDPRLVVIAGTVRPAGWSGKLWAIRQGVAEAGAAELILLTDADIVHQPAHVRALVCQIQRQDGDMVSEMVRLACDSWAERALVPAFVFFFQLLYPFARVNDPLMATAAAAGGTILIRQRALLRIGGIDRIGGALIDDVALAREVKKGGRIWLGHATLARSVRAYPAAADIWRMIARTAYVQLRRSPLLLVATVAGMAVVWLVPVGAALFGHGIARGCGLAAWAMSAAAYLPTLRRFGRGWLWAPLLPLIAAFYMAATVGSAVDHVRGRGVAWKGRAYQRTAA